MKTNSDYKPGSVVCAPIEDIFIGCVHCGESTGKPTHELAKVKGASQFACGSCGKVAIYRYGPFPGDPTAYTPPPPVEMDNWADFVTEEDFL